MLLLKCLFIGVLAISIATAIILAYAFIRLSWIMRSLDRLNAVIDSYLMTRKTWEELQVIDLDNLFTDPEIVIDTFYIWNKWLLLKDGAAKDILKKHEKEMKERIK